MGGIRTRLFVTHACMVARTRSTPPRGDASTPVRRSPTKCTMYKSAASAARFSPDHFRRGVSRPVRCYAIFKWWLPLSQHPGCPRGPTSFKPLSAPLGALAGGPGCFPFDRGAYPPRSDSSAAIRRYSEFGRLRQPGRAPRSAGRSTPVGERAGLALKLFRREPAITGFDWSFAPIRKSSKDFSTSTGSALRPALSRFRPAHG